MTTSKIQELAQMLFEEGEDYYHITDSELIYACDTVGVSREDAGLTEDDTYEALAKVVRAALKKIQGA